MGFFSKIVKGAKNIFKGIGKAVTKVFKEVKRFVKSDIGKFVIAAAAIYYGGKAMEWWGTGAETAAPAAAELSSSTIAQAPASSALSAIDPVTGVPEAMLTGGTEAASGLAPVVKSAPAWEAPVAQQAAQTQAINQAGLASQAGKLTKEAGKGIFNWMEKNPVLTLGAGNLLSGALAPDPYEERIKYEKWLRNNSNVAGVMGDGSGAPIGVQGLVGRANENPTYSRGRT